MKLTPKSPPRRYRIGRNDAIEIRDCGSLALEPDEQVTLTTPNGGEYDVARKDWGFYATPSTNARLAGFGLRAALVRNSAGRLFVMLVENGKEGAFEEYLTAEKQEVLCWLDTDEAVSELTAAVNGRPPR